MQMIAMIISSTPKSSTTECTAALLKFYQRRVGEIAHERQHLADTVEVVRVPCARRHAVEWEESVRKKEIAQLDDAYEKVECELSAVRRVVVNLCERNEDWKVESERKSAKLKECKQQARLRVEAVRVRPNVKMEAVTELQFEPDNNSSHCIHRHPRIGIPQVAYLPYDRMEAIEEREVTLEDAIKRYIDNTRAAEAQLDGIIESSKRDFDAAQAAYRDAIEQIEEQTKEIKRKHHTVIAQYLKQRFDLQALQHRFEDGTETLLTLQREKKALSEKLKVVIQKRRDSREAVLSAGNCAPRIFPFRKGCAIATVTAQLTSQQLDDAQTMAHVHLLNLHNHIAKVRAKCKKLETDDRAELMCREEEMTLLKERMGVLQEVVAEVFATSQQFHRKEELVELVAKCADDVDALQHRLSCMRGEKNIST
eukprot:GEMP01047262.1.p1 GENE.GEMP01047262.1~~GEMP01047262.1.p1  ORF type:complete len:424 (+),score=125.41 GEMP01047262.1:140-1411(+)